MFFIMLDKISEFFGIKSKRFLGVDIGSSTIRLVELSKKGQIVKLENYGEISLKDNASLMNFSGKSLKNSDKVIGERIKLILKEADIKEKDVGFSIPDFGSFFTTVKLPVMEKEEIEQALKYQVRPYIPLSLEDVTLDWSIIDGEPSKTKTRVLVVAIPNNIIDSYKAIVQFTNLNLKFLEPEIFPLARSSIKKESKKIVALIDMGETSTTCSVLKNGVVKVSHSFNIAGNELTSVIARSLNINYNEAEKLKNKEGLLPSSEVKHPRGIRELLLPLTGSIVDEIKKAFRNFFVQEGKEVESIILFGGLSTMPGLKEFFTVELKKPISIANPFLGIAAPPGLGVILKEKGPYYGVAIGLALKGLE